MPASQSEVLVGRRYMERGFLDKAMKLFIRNAALVTPADWALLADRLMERDRVMDVVRICEVGSVPLPRERMLAIGDAHLERRNVDSAIRFYEMAGADRDRWARVVDLLTAMPEREFLAIGIAERYLGVEPALEEVQPPRRIQVVK
ncbi:MAG TPA: hypothetical protein VKW76_10215 [Candidatus Binatia bacterium]|nr:hypothetical protein [Candidatus Binatia bacterium]